ncbi:MAG: hypothetical protein Q9157_006019 [Trypethelium eluteriae]
MRMERLKTIISIALKNDYFKLAQEIQKNTSSIRASLPILETHAADEKHSAVMQWLATTDFSAQQQDIIFRRQDGTAQWFLDSPEFKSWLQGSDKTLFCPGIPGAGKMMMAAVAIDHIYRVAYSDRVGIAHLFCSYKAQINQTVHNLLAILLRQLVQSRPDLAAPVVELYDRHSKHGNKASLGEVMVLSTLDKMSQGLAALNNAYNEAIKWIDGQLEEDKILAKRAISWISYAQRLLTISKLCCALAVEPDGKALNPDNIYNIEDVISVCAGLITMILEQESRSNIEIDSKDSYGLTPLSWAAKKGHEAVVRQLLATEKVDIDAKDEAGQTPLLWAAKGGHEAVVRQLLATEKVDINMKDKAG